MKPEIDTLQLNAFVDGESDLSSQLEIEEHTREDAGFRAQVEGLRQLREAIRERASYHAPPLALRKRVATTGAPSLAALIPQDAGTSAVQRWLGWRPMAVSLGLVTALTLAIIPTWLRSVRESRLTEEVVASHVRATLGQHLVDVASSDHHVVKPWLSAKLDFSPPVRELQLPGSVFLGGRVDYLAGRPVAALVYRQGEHVVNSFVWPNTDADSIAVFSTERGFQVAHWARGGMNHWVISDVNRQEFEAVVRAVDLRGGEP
jgi:anti-sigma factor RsiW